MTPAVYHFRNLNPNNIYRPQTKLREGNVFTGVCDPVHGGGGVRAPGSAWSREGLLQGGCLFQGVPALGGGLLLGGCLLREGCLVETPPPMATAAGGTHPTGMHSCIEPKLFSEVE